MPDEFGAAEGAPGEGVADPGGVWPILTPTFSPPAVPVVVEGGGGTGETFSPAQVPTTVEPSREGPGRGILGGAPTRDDGVSAGDSGPTIGAPTPGGGGIPTATLRPSLLAEGPAAGGVTWAGAPRWAWIVGGSILATALLWIVAGKRRRD